MKNNICINTDVYKFLNNASLQDVENIFSYFESRKGAKYPKTIFFGLQYFLKEYLEGKVVTKDGIKEASFAAKCILGNSESFNRPLWESIYYGCNGRLPISIKSVLEGTEVKESNVLMTIQLTQDNPRLVGIVNHLETLLTNVWSTCTVATKGKAIKRILMKYGEETCEKLDHINYQLHDFAQRSVKCPEQAATSGMAHLINFYGTDTVLAWQAAQKYYGADPFNCGKSIFATEHNYMMYRGKEGEEKVVGEILDLFPNGPISVVGDTFNIYNFVDNIVGKTYRDKIRSRNGVFVVRPDSVTPDHSTSAKISLWILESLYKNFGGERNNKGYIVLHPSVRIIYGDSLDEISIEDILLTCKRNGFASENLVFGCGSYLLDKHNRDTQRFAYKSSAMKINGEWKGVFKSPIGSNKQSKCGRLKLILNEQGEFETLTESHPLYYDHKDELIEVFRNGKLLVDQQFSDIRKRVGLLA